MRPASCNYNEPERRAARRARCWRGTAWRPRWCIRAAAACRCWSRAASPRWRQRRGTSRARCGDWIDKGYDIIALVPSCALMLKFEWPLILPDDAGGDAAGEGDLTTSANTSWTSRARKGWRRACGRSRAASRCTWPATRGRRTWARRRPRCCACCPEPDVAVIERCSGHGGSWGFKRCNFDTALKVGRPAARQARDGGKAFVTSECPLAGVASGAGHRAAWRRRGQARTGAPIRSSCSRGPTASARERDGHADGQPWRPSTRSPQPTSCRPRNMPSTAPSGAARIGDAQAQPPDRGRPVRDVLFRILRHDVAAGAGDAAHREGRRGAGARRAGGLQSAGPEGRGAGRHLHDRDRRSGRRASASWSGWAASRRPHSCVSPARRFAARPRPTRTAPRRRARRPRCSSCISPSPRRRSPLSRARGPRSCSGWTHPNYGHMAVLPEAVRAELASDFD